MYMSYNDIHNFPLFSEDENIGSLADLYVDENRRRRGLGRALLTGLAAAARRDGARWMFWSVLKRNRGARRFYKKVAPELKDVIVCAAFGRRFNALADRAL